MPSPKKITVLRIDDELSEKLKILAEEEIRSLNNYIEKVLIDHVRNIEISSNRQIQIGHHSTINNYGKKLLLIFLKLFTFFVILHIISMAEIIKRSSVTSTWPLTF